MKTSVVNIVIPLAGNENRFTIAGYNVPKPLVEVDRKAMIEKVIENLKPKQIKYNFIFILKKDEYERYGQYLEIFSRVTNGNFTVITISYTPKGAACTVLCAIDHINSENELIIANGDQMVETSIDDFIKGARIKKASGYIMTFEASHPKWSFVRLNKNSEVIETAEKRVISNHATTGIYYFKHGSLFVKAALTMIEKDIRFNDDFYVCPSFNELILQKEKVLSLEIDRKKMHSMGSPEDLAKYLHFLETGYNNGDENNNSYGRKRIKVQSKSPGKSRIQSPKTVNFSKRYSNGRLGTSVTSFHRNPKLRIKNQKKGKR